MKKEQAATFQLNAKLNCWTNGTTKSDCTKNLFSKGVEAYPTNQGSMYIQQPSSSSVAHHVVIRDQEGRKRGKHIILIEISFNFHLFTNFSLNLFHTHTSTWEGETVPPDADNFFPI